MCLACLCQSLAGQEAIPIPSIPVPSVAVKSVPLADAPLRRSLAAWDRRWARARYAAGESVRLEPGRYAPLWFQRLALLRRITAEGWTASTESAWDAYWRLLGASTVRAAKTFGRHTRGLTKP